MFDSKMTKASELILTAMGAVDAVAVIISEPVPFNSLLKKRVFPNRNVPHRVKRKRKDTARVMNDFKLMRAAMLMSMAAAQYYKIQSTPTTNQTTNAPRTNA